jgi:hypothetical protein
MLKILAQKSATCSKKQMLPLLLDRVGRRELLVVMNQQSQLVAGSETEAKESPLLKADK